MNKTGLLKFIFLMAIAVTAIAYFSLKEKVTVSEKSEAKQTKTIEQTEPVVEAPSESKTESASEQKNPLLVKTPLDLQIEKICSQGKEHNLDDVQKKISSLKLGHKPDLVNLHFMYDGKRYCLQWNEEETENGEPLETITFFVLDHQDFPTKVAAPFKIRTTQNIATIKQELKGKVGKLILENELGEISSDGENMGRYEATDGAYLKLDLDSMSCEGETCLCHH